MNVTFGGLARRVSVPVLAASLILSQLLASLPARAADEGREEAGPRLFAAQALALRAAGAAGEETVAGIIAEMPGAAIMDREVLPLLWSGFFQNAAVKLGRLSSPEPVALYYNPLLDVALITLWKEGEGGYGLASARALPGERLSQPDAEAPLHPAWTGVADGPPAALKRIAANRLRTFRQAHPVDDPAAGRDVATYAAAAADLRASLPRLVWSAGRYARWAEAESWLRPALAAVSEALAAGNASTLRASAPLTDPETAAALADLPAAFTDSLVLDMVLEGGETDRLLIGSSPDDGDIYVLAVCELEGSACALRRLVLLSLLD